MACITALLQPLSGDRSAKHVARRAAGEARGGRGALRTRRARAPLQLGGIARPGDRRVPRRDARSRAACRSGLRRPRRARHRARGVPARRLAAGAGRAHRLPRHGRRRARAMALVALAVVAWCCAGAGCPDSPALVLAFVVAGPARVRRARGGLAGHRVGPAAMGRARADAHGRRRHRLPLQGGAVLAVHARLRLPRYRRSSTCWRSRSSRRRPAAEPAPREPPCRLSCCSRRRSASRSASTSSSAAPTSAAACGISWRSGPRAAAAAARHRARDRPDLGGEPRLAHPGRRHPVHRLSAGVRRDLARAARPADAVPGRGRAPRLGVRVPRARHARRPTCSGVGASCSRWRA